MTRPVLRTERIELRPMRPEHLPLLHHLDSDPEVMRYLLGRARSPQETDDFWGPRRADTTGESVGLGWWVGLDVTGEFLGWWDIGRSSSDPAEPVDTVSASMGWRVPRARSRQGFASEAARELLRHGFESVGLQRVTAETMAINAGSRGAMRAIGMRHLSTEVREWPDPIPGWEQGEVIYGITAQQWRNYTL